MPTVWSENDLITAEKLNNTGIDDVLDLGVLDIDLGQENWSGALNDGQIEKLENCKFIKFTCISSSTPDYPVIYQIPVYVKMFNKDIFQELHAELSLHAFSENLSIHQIGITIYKQKTSYIYEVKQESREVSFPST